VRLNTTGWLMARLFTIFTVFFLIPAFLTGLFNNSVYAADEADPQIIHVAQIEGRGIVKIRRARGTEIIAAVGDKLSPGDKIVTDGESTVDLNLNDGTLIRVGLNTDYTVEAIEEEKPGLWSWSFGMVSGSIRALVEKSKQKGFVKFKVNTPSGTMGVRGTEILLTERDDTLELTTLHGEALLGPTKADFKNIKQFVSVGAGYRSWIKKGMKRAVKPIPFTMKDLLVKRAKVRSSGEAGDGSYSVGEAEKTSAGESKEDADTQALLVGIRKKLHPEALSNAESKALLEKMQREFNNAKETISKTYGTGTGATGGATGSDTNFASNSSGAGVAGGGSASGAASSAGADSSRNKNAGFKLESSGSGAGPVGNKYSGGSASGGGVTSGTTSNTSNTSKTTVASGTKNNAMAGTATVKKRDGSTTLTRTSREQINAMNQLFEDSRPVIAEAPPPPAPATPSNNDFGRGQISQPPQYQAPGGTGSVGTTGSGVSSGAANTAPACYETYTYWKKYCKNRFLGICTDHGYECQGSETQISCPAGQSSGSRIQRTNSECRLGERRG